MAFDLDLFAEIIRLIMGFVLLWLFIFFYKRYTTSKKNGFDNPIFIGFLVLFATLFIFHFAYGIYNLLVKFGYLERSLTDNFSWYNEEQAALPSFTNQYRPLYLIFYSLLNVIIGAQVYSLERILDWKKHPMSIFMLTVAALLWLCFIPAVLYSVVSAFLIVLGFVSIASGFFLNIGLNLWLASKSPGQVRRRSLFAAAAFLLTALGLLWAMEVGFGPLIHDSISNNMDVIIGSGIELIGCLCYFKGFAKTDV